MIAHIKSPEPPADTVLVVKNIHLAEAGPPPRLVDDGYTTLLTLYFTNDVGDQFVLQYDRNKRVGILRAGDAGWTHEIKIRNDALPTDIIFGFRELTVIAAVWEMWTGRKLAMPACYKFAEAIRQFTSET
jgi:hypothetical protein